jgi:hypothetical protein
MSEVVTNPGKWPVLISWSNWQLAVPPARATTLFRRLYKGMPPPASGAVLNLVSWEYAIEIPGIVKDVEFHSPKHNRPLYSQKHMIDKLRCWITLHRPMLVEAFDAAIVANEMDPTWLPGVSDASDP